jgi:hypothetical protein
MGIAGQTRNRSAALAVFRERQQLTVHSAGSALSASALFQAYGSTTQYFADWHDPYPTPDALLALLEIHRADGVDDELRQLLLLKYATIDCLKRQAATARQTKYDEYYQWLLRFDEENARVMGVTIVEWGCQPSDLQNSNQYDAFYQAFRHAIKEPHADSNKTDWLPEDECHLQIAISALLSISRQQPGPDGQEMAFRGRGVMKTRKELEVAERRAKSLIDQIEELNENAIDALARCGQEREPLLGLLKRFCAAAERSKDLDLPNAPDRGAPPANRARVVARIVICAFEKLAVTDATVSGKSKGLVTLVGKIFKLLEIKEHPKAMINAAQTYRQGVPSE